MANIMISECKTYTPEPHNIEGTVYQFSYKTWFLTLENGYTYEIMMAVKNGKFNYFSGRRLPKGLQLSNGMGKTFHSFEELDKAYKPLRGSLEFLREEMHAAA